MALPVAVLLAVAMGILVAKWPFSRAALTRELEGLGQGTVQIGSFRTTYFPPGCVATHVVFSSDDRNESQPQVTVEKLTIVGSYLGMFEHPKHIRRVEVENVRVTRALSENDAKSSRNSSFASAHKSNLVIDELHATQAQLNVTRRGSQEPLRFQVRELFLGHLQSGKPFSFRVETSIPKIKGDAVVSGNAGPLNAPAPGKTPLRGEFTLNDADLGTFNGIAGKVSGSGRFHGELGRLNVDGEASSPEFIVRKTQHGLPLSAKFHAVVDGTNGDVNIENAEATLGQTVMHTTGQIVKDGNDTGKTVSLQMSGRHGRIQDLFYLFVHQDSPIAGSTNFDAKVTLEPKPGRFVDKVILDATFGIDDSKFTKPTTQQKVNTLSERAQGDTKDQGEIQVASVFDGHVRLENAIARFSKLDIAVPCASADLHGTFNVESHVVDLRGMLRPDVKLSQASTGFKSFLMKVIEFAKQKKKQGALVPVKITGRYPKPSFDIDATKEK